MAKTATIQKSHKSESVIKTTLAERMRKIAEIKGKKKTREELAIYKMSIKKREEWKAKRIFRKLLKEIREVAERKEFSLEYLLRRSSVYYICRSLFY